jgi:hypothetical protein
MVAVTRQAESKMDLMAITTAKTISPMDTKNQYVARHWRTPNTPAAIPKPWPETSSPR